ncbi:excisionase family DNA-binding protein [Herbaspirillum sp. AP02]|uniref:GAF domain-containing protein n=1 Tax=unclassified Herbaspirillum TaxID=2624150 RepID=UPI0015DB9C64|nr:MULTISPECIES: GAF domain-containing protein [unclassified Herbaspirillum]MBG7621628.1 excisionase family DNA-binding protein [Herbaspirillum sp. AP02]NZD69715.1 excisionase family DNA-binding protein [Herbaspirillum sp. AP21]
MSNSDPAMTSREAAKMLGVSITTAQMWMESGMLASWKTPGGHRRTRLSSVMTLIGHQDMPALDATAAGDEPGTATYAITGEEAGRSRFVEEVNARSQADARFDRLTWLVSELLDVPISLITFLTSELQLFRSAHGVNLSSTPRAWAFCNYTINQPGVFCVTDAQTDARFMNNPMVTSAPFFRFYAGIRLMYEGKAFGSLCAIDTEPRILRSHERQALEELALLATDILRLHILESR